MIRPCVNSYARLLKECTKRKALGEGKQVHALIFANGLGSNLFLGNSLLHMYTQCSGSLLHAHNLFHRMPKRNVYSWTILILAYAKEGHGQEALILFQRMQEEGIEPSEVTFVAVLKACAVLGLPALEQGKQVHALVEKTKKKINTHIGSSLVDMYAKCGSLEDAREVFDGMCHRDVVLWTAIISGYVQSGHYREAIALLREMWREGVTPNQVTLVSVLNASAAMAALDLGKETHASIEKSGFETDVVIGNGLVDMYAKCGSIKDARRVFDGMHPRDVVTWNAMIAGYAQHGHGKEAIFLFKKMLLQGVKPDRASFISVLSACSHEGLVEEAWGFFDLMREDFCTVLSFQHYGCMVNLLGRQGHLAEAEELIKKMPFEANATIWKMLLGACTIHGNTELGRRAFDRALNLEQKKSM